MAAAALSTQLAFDYGDMPASDSKALERHAETVLRIQERQRTSTIENAFKLGEELAEARNRLSNHGNGTFGKWCKERLGMSSQTARNLIAVHEGVPEKDCQTVLQSFDLTALYKLLSDTAPEEAYRDAVKLAKKGEPITSKVAKEIISSHTVEGHVDDSDEASDDAEETEPDSFDWQPADFVTATRKHVRQWIERCPSEELHYIYETLRDLAAQIERKQDGSSDA
jgi:hypothetical protein